MDRMDRMVTPGPEASFSGSACAMRCGPISVSRILFSSQLPFNATLCYTDFSLIFQCSSWLANVSSRDAYTTSPSSTKQTSASESLDLAVSQLSRLQKIQMQQQMQKVEKSECKHQHGNMWSTEILRERIFRDSHAAAAVSLRGGASPS